LFEERYHSADYIGGGEVDRPLFVPSFDAAIVQQIHGARQENPCATVRLH
jgi:hypothetical protein